MASVLWCLVCSCVTTFLLNCTTSDVDLLRKALTTSYEEPLQYREIHLSHRSLDAFRGLSCISLRDVQRVVLTADVCPAAVGDLKRICPTVSVSNFDIARHILNHFVYASWYSRAELFRWPVIEHRRPSTCAPNGHRKPTSSPLLHLLRLATLSQSRSQFWASASCCCPFCGSASRHRYGTRPQCERSLQPSVGGAGLRLAGLRLP
jgi:hypothetical protein